MRIFGNLFRLFIVAITIVLFYLVDKTEGNIVLYNIVLNIFSLLGFIYLDNFKEKLTHIPLGKASPELLKNIKVMYQSKSHFISEIATIEAINEIELLIKPNDISALKPIEKALINSGLDIEVETYENNIIVSYFMLKEIRAKLIEEVDKHLTEFKLNFNDHKQDLIKKIKSDNSINLDEQQLNQNLSLLAKESKAILSHVNSLMLQKNRKQRLTPIQKEINKVKKISMN